MIDTVDDYQAVVEQIKDRYEERIVAFLVAIVQTLQQSGWTGTEVPYEMHDCDFNWHVCVTPPGGDDEASIEVDVTIEESLECAGDLNGVTLGLGLHGWGGLIVGELRPYNFTPEVWVPVDDDDAIEARFELILNEGVVAGAVDYLLSGEGQRT